MKKDYKFHGYDFSELFDCFDIVYGDEIPNMNYESDDEDTEIVDEEDLEEDLEEELLSEENLDSTKWKEWHYELTEEDREMYEEEERKNQESIKNLQEFIKHHGCQLWQKDYLEKEELEESELVYQKCIEFLDALIEDSRKWNYMCPFWEGLRKVEDKGTLLQLYAELINHMWT